MFLSPIQSRENLANQGEISLMKENDLGVLTERFKLVIYSYDRFKKEIDAIVNFSQQKEKLLEEVNFLDDMKRIEQISVEDLAERLINLASKIATFKAIEPILTKYLQKFNDIKDRIKAEGQEVVDSMQGQYETLNVLVEKGLEKINGFNPQGEYPVSYFIEELAVDLLVLDADFNRFKNDNHAIVVQREKDRNQLNEAVKSLRLKTSPWSSDASGGLVSNNLDKLGQDISKLDIRVEKNINDAKHRLQEQKSELSKPILSSFLDKSVDPINTINEYKAKLNQAGKIAQAKANAFSSIIKKFDLIQASANSSDFVNSKEMVDNVQTLEDEIQNQRNTLAQYRGITFFRPLMRCLGRGEVTSLEHVAKLEHVIENFKWSVTAAI